MKVFLFFIFLPFFTQAFDPTFGNKSYPKFNETAYEAELLSFEDEQVAIKFFKPKVEENQLIGRRFFHKSSS